MLTKDEQLATSQQFVRHYKFEAKRLEVINAGLLEALAVVMAYAETLDDEPPYYRRLCVATAYARGEWGES